ncbi:TetR/AcrR family transcriptional regulator [Intestinibacter sp.]
MNSKKDKTRERIIYDSYRLFAEKGFNKITMKDVCEVTNLSRGGLYSHFSSTRELFETILEEINQKDEMNFYEEMEQALSAVQILDNALLLMEDEMNHPEDSLSLAMYEYAGSVDNDLMNQFNKIGEEKWTALIKYGIERGEFNNVDVVEIVNIILYAYQGIRMWSRIVPMTQEVFNSITSHIKKQLIKGEIENGISN